MQPYRLIIGNTQKITEFEQTISSLLEDGYALEGPLVASHHATGTQLFQAMIAEDYYLEDDEEHEEDDEEEDE